MHPLYRYLARNNNVGYAEFTPLHLGGVDVGLLHGRIAAPLIKAGLILEKDSHLVLINDHDAQARTARLKEILRCLIAEGFVRKERFELYDVAPHYRAAPLALADRALMPALGFPAIGIHCNAYVMKDGTLHLWIARRSLNSAVDPGKLDHLVAGGQPHGLSLADNLAKEAWEEAAIPPELAATAVAAGCVRYARQEAHNLRRDTLFIFDLALPESFSPASNDGESFDFRLMHIDDVKNRLLQTDDFKFNVPLVLIDFMIRRGFIGPEEPGYCELATGLRPSL